MIRLYSHLPDAFSLSGASAPHGGTGEAQYGPQRADLGWAIDEEAGFGATLIYYPQGFYSPDCTWMPKSGIYELTDEHGTVYQFVGAGGVARIVTAISEAREKAPMTFTRTGGETLKIGRRMTIPGAAKAGSHQGFNGRRQR